MIEVSSLSKRFGSFEAVKDLSFTINKGEIVGLLGPNGAGKTTTMRMITGFLIPTKGTVLINKKSISEESLHIRKQIGYLPENNPLYHDFTVEEFLDFECGIRRLRGTEKKRALTYAVTKCGLEDIYYKTIGILSKGLKQRVGLAAAILHQPDILVLDEPTSGLDPKQTVEIRELLKELAKNHTIIFSSHIMQEVEAVCSRVLIINNGQLVASGDPKNLSTPESVELEKDEVLMELTFSMPMTEAKEQLPKLFPKGTFESPKRGEVLMTTPIEKGKDARMDILSKIVRAKLPLMSMKEKEANLEDAFLALTA